MTRAWQAGAAVAPKKPKQESSDQPSFEEALNRLEEIVHLLEEGEIGLDEALQRYEEGVKLLRQAYDLLGRAERRIELLSGVDAEGNPISRPFGDQATLSPDDEP
ncbi:MAG: exodeoxyribonuclease VII small subunit [Planctomycetota bacterium]|jgi:exodeoxyribonuclease VII small subunit